VAKSKKKTTSKKSVQNEEQVVSAEEKQVIEQPEVTEQVAAAITEESSVSAEDEKPAEVPPEAEKEVDKAASTSEESAPTPEIEKKASKQPVSKSEKSNKHIWQRVMIGVGLFLTILIFVVGGFSQIYKGKVLPSVFVAGTESSGKSEEALKAQLEEQAKQLNVTFQNGKNKVSPSLKEIGYEVDVEQTIENAISAKRDSMFARFAFWHKTNVPAVISVNNSLLTRYADEKFPELTQAGQDARLEYDALQSTFVVTNHKDGTGPDSMALKEQLEKTAEDLQDTTIKVTKTKKPAKITEEKLTQLVELANDIVSRSIVLQGTVGTYQVAPADIALWVTPTPQKDGTIELVIDDAKVQSYVEALGRQIATTPEDKKVIKEKNGKEVVLQAGRDGTELANVAELTNGIVEAVNKEQNVTLTMNIKTAKAKVVNLTGYDKWIEVDLTNQTVTAYEKATPLKTFVIASGLPGFETPTGEYEIWLRVRKQTMQGGSKADGSYYNIPNVEWVSYFYGDYALHGAWWREKFGAPASHGCVNMTNADAKWVYDWAPLGTKVIVHY